MEFLPASVNTAIPVGNRTSVGSKRIIIAANLISSDSNLFPRYPGALPIISAPIKLARKT